MGASAPPKGCATCQLQTLLLLEGHPAPGWSQVPGAPEPPDGCHPTPETSLFYGASYRAGSQQACSKCDPCPPFQFSKQPSGTNSLGQAPCPRTNGSSIRDSWKGHLGSGTRLSSPVLEVRTPKLKKANARTWRNRQERVTHDCTSLELVN